MRIVPQLCGDKDLVSWNPGLLDSSADCRLSTVTDDFKSAASLKLLATTYILAVSM